jgi:hypothetical protein
MRTGKPMRRSSPEEVLRIAVVRLLSFQRIEGLWWSAMGMKAGVPDLLFVYEGRPIAIELKADNGRVSDEQQGMAAQMERAGCPVMVARSLDAVVAILAAHGVPINGRNAA